MQTISTEHSLEGGRAVVTIDEFDRLVEVKAQPHWGPKEETMKGAYLVLVLQALEKQGFIEIKQ